MTKRTLTVHNMVTPTVYAGAFYIYMMTVYTQVQFIRGTSSKLVLLFLFITVTDKIKIVHFLFQNLHTTYIYFYKLSMHKLSLCKLIPHNKNAVATSTQFMC